MNGTAGISRLGWSTRRVPRGTTWLNEVVVYFLIDSVEANSNMIMARGSWSVRSVIRNSSSQELSYEQCRWASNADRGLNPTCVYKPRTWTGQTARIWIKYESLDRHAHTEREKKKMRGEKKARWKLTRTRHPQASKFPETLIGSRYDSIDAWGTKIGILQGWTSGRIAGY